MLWRIICFRNSVLFLKCREFASENNQIALLDLKKNNMKTLVTLIICLFSLAAAGQKLTREKVPVATRTAFAKAHPGITPQWEKEDGNYEADFSENGKEASCVISRKGTILETETSIPLANLPAAAGKYVNEHFKGKTPEEVARIETSSGVVSYEVVVAGKNILFDRNGKVLKSSKDKKD